MRIAVFDNGDYYLYIERLLSQIYEIAGSGIFVYNSSELFEFDTVNRSEQFDILIMVLDESQDSMEKQIAMAKRARETEACFQVIFIAPEDRLIPLVYSVDHAFMLARSHVPTLFIIAVQKAVENVLSMDRRVICVTVDYGKRWIPLRQIYYLESINRKTEICLEKTMLETTMSIAINNSNFCGTIKQAGGGQLPSAGFCVGIQPDFLFFNSGRAVYVKPKLRRLNTIYAKISAILPGIC